MTGEEKTGTEPTNVTADGNSKSQSGSNKKVLMSFCAAHITHTSPMSTLHNNVNVQYINDSVIAASMATNYLMTFQSIHK